MTTEKIYKILQEELTDELSGQLTHDGTVLKWEYDGFSHLHDDLETHLDLIAHEDKERIEEILGDNSEFIFTEPETHDTYVFFYIEK